MVDVSFTLPQMAMLPPEQEKGEKRAERSSKVSPLSGI